jgi:hypothetical protein
MRRIAGCPSSRRSPPARAARLHLETSRATAELDPRVVAAASDAVADDRLGSAPAAIAGIRSRTACKVRRIADDLALPAAARGGWSSACYARYFPQRSCSHRFNQHAAQSASAVETRQEPRALVRHNLPAAAARRRSRVALRWLGVAPPGDAPRCAVQEAVGFDVPQCRALTSVPVEPRETGGQP